MALDVYMHPVPKLPPIGDEYVYIGSLDNDGYYWFLYPLFDALYRDSGEIIDLYGDAVFHGDTLEMLDRTLASARVLVGTQPETWDVATGTTVEALPREIRSVVNKCEMLALLDKLESGVNRAREAGYCIMFWGD